MRIAITGGPCAGKTELIDSIRHTKIGTHKIVALPESATILRNAGIWDNNLIKFQTSVLKFQMMIEDLADIEDTIQICDRGCLDGIAYTNDFDIVMRNVGVDLDQLMQRYDVVIHLQTAAANDFFTAENNTARIETTPKEALDADKRCQEAWNKHPRFFFIDGSTVEEKINKAVWTISRIVNDAKLP